MSLRIGQIALGGTYVPTGTLDLFSGAESVLGSFVFDAPRLRCVATGDPAKTANNQTNTSLTIPFPNGVQVGDLVTIDVQGECGTASTNVGFVDPSGWTKIDEAFDTGTPTPPTAASWQKQWALSDGASVTVTWTNAGQAVGAASVYRGHDTTTPIGEVQYDTKVPTDASYTVSLTTTATGIIRSGFGNRSGHTLSAYTDRLRWTDLNTSAATLLVQDTDTVVPAGSYTKTATGSGSTSLGSNFAYLIRQAPVSSTVPVSAARATTWNVAAAVSNARATTWHALASVAGSRASTWNVLAAISNARATTWNVRAAISNARATTWNALATATASRATTWNALASASASRATTWNVLSVVGNTRATLWNVASSLVAVSSSRATTWNVRAAVSAARATTWNVLAGVSAARATTWNVLAAVSASRSTLWNVAGTLASVLSARATTWNVFAAVSASRSTTWNVRALVAAARSTTWSVLRTVSAARATTWGALTAVAGARATSWRVAAQVTSSRATTWAVQWLSSPRGIQPNRAPLTRPARPNPLHGPRRPYLRPRRPR